MNAERPYPEHQKVKSVSAETQAAGEFFEWLQRERGYKMVGPAGTYTSIENLLADWKSIDRGALEREKQAMVKRAATLWDGKAAGTPCVYWTGRREGDGKRGVTTSTLTKLGGHTWGVYVAGAGFIAATHVEPVGGAA